MHNVTEEFEVTFYDEGTTYIMDFVRQVLEASNQSKFSAAISIVKDCDGEWICKATASHQKE